ncbi:MAG: DUF5667 domain-containing protein [bacterium]|nr:DUF5667 domain-containing protein [bacterium]
MLNLSISRVSAAESGSGSALSVSETRIERESGEEIRSLGVETTGILPSNPFYFFKEWGRGIRKALSFNTLSRAELQLDIANEQAAEIVKLQELDIKNPDAYSRAVASYDQSVVLAEARIAALKGMTAPTDRFVLTVIDRALRHSDILDALYARIAADDAEASVLAQLFTARTDIVKTVAAVADVVGNNDRAVAYTNTVIGRMTRKWHELKAVEFINRWENIAPQSLRDGLVVLKANLMLQLSGRLLGASLEDFEGKDESRGDALAQLPGAPLERLRSLDALRESVADSDIKNYANLVRSKLFDVIRSGNLAQRADAETLLKQAAAVLASIDAFTGVKGRIIVPEAAKATTRAKFTYDGAVKFFDEGSFAAAYAQGSAALGTAESVYANFLLGSGDVAGDVRALKQDFDGLGATVRAAGATKEGRTELFTALGNAERAIAKVADLVNANASAERVVDAIRLAKRLIGAASQLTETRSAVSVGEAESAFGSAAEAPAVVQMNDKQFVPAVVKIKKGGAVMWVNRDADTHWIIASSEKGREALDGFDSRRGIATGETYSFIFKSRGTWKYIDKLHPEMTGVVDVE